MVPYLLKISESLDFKSKFKIILVRVQKTSLPSIVNVGELYNMRECAKIKILNTTYLLRL